MRKLLTALFSVLLLLSAAGCAAAGVYEFGDYTFTNPPAGNDADFDYDRESVSIDGSLDDELWQNATFFETQYAPAAYTINMRFSAVLGDTGVYVAFDTDDPQVYWSRGRSNSWNSGIEFYFAPYGRHSIDTSAYEIPMSAGGTYFVRRCMNGETFAAYPYEILLRTSVRGEINTDNCEGYVLEAFIPYETLNITTPPFRAAFHYALIRNDSADESAERDLWFDIGPQTLSSYNFMFPTTWLTFDADGVCTEEVTLTAGEGGAVRAVTPQAVERGYYTVELLPEAGYVLGGLTVNGKDVLSDISYDSAANTASYTCTVTGALDINAQYVALPEETHTLSGTLASQIGEVDYSQLTVEANMGTYYASAPVQADGSFSIEVAALENVTFRVGCDGAMTVKEVRDVTADAQVNWTLRPHALGGGTAGEADGIFGLDDEYLGGFTVNSTDSYPKRIYFTDEGADAGDVLTVSAKFTFADAATAVDDIRKGITFSAKDASGRTVEAFGAILYDYVDDFFTIQFIGCVDRGDSIWNGNVGENWYNGTEIYNKLMSGEEVTYTVTLLPTGAFIAQVENEDPAYYEYNIDGFDFTDVKVYAGFEFWNAAGSRVSDFSYTYEAVNGTDLLGHSSIDRMVGRWDTREAAGGKITFLTAPSNYDKRIYFTDETADEDETQTVSATFGFPEVAVATDTLYKGFVFANYNETYEVTDRVYYAIVYDYANDRFLIQRIPWIDRSMTEDGHYGDWWWNFEVCTLAESGSELYEKLVNGTVEFEISLSPSGFFTLSVDGQAVEMAAGTDSIVGWNMDFASGNTVVGIEVRGRTGEIDGCEFTNISYTHEVVTYLFDSSSIVPKQGAWDTSEEEGTLTLGIADIYDSRIWFTDETAALDEEQTVSGHFNFSDVAQAPEAVYKGFSFASYNQAKSRVDRVFYAITYIPAGGTKEEGFWLYRVPNFGGENAWWTGNTETLIAANGTDLYNTLTGADGFDFKVTLSPAGTFSFFIDGESLEAPAAMRTCTEDGADFANTNVVVGVEVWGVGTNWLLTDTVITELSYTHAVPEVPPVFGNSTVQNAQGAWETGKEQEGTLTLGLANIYDSRIYFLDETAELNETQIVSGHFDFAEVSDDSVTIPQPIYKGFTFAYHDGTQTVRVYYALTYIPDGYRDSPEEFRLTRLPNFGGSDWWWGNNEYDIAAAGSDLFNKLTGSSGFDFKVELSPDGTFALFIDGEPLDVPAAMLNCNDAAADFAGTNVVVGVEIWGIGTEPNGTFTEYPTTITNLTYTHEVVTEPEPEPEPEPVFGTVSENLWAAGTWDTTQEEEGTLTFTGSEWYDNRIYFLDGTAALNETQTVSGIFTFPTAPTTEETLYQGFTFAYYDANSQSVVRVFYGILYHTNGGNFQLWRIPTIGTDVWSNNLEMVVASSGEPLYDKFINEGVEFKVSLSPEGVFRVWIDGTEIELPEGTDTCTESGADFASTNVYIAVEVRSWALAGSGAVIKGLEYTHSVPETQAVFGSSAVQAQAGVWDTSKESEGALTLGTSDVYENRIFFTDESAAQSELQTVSGVFSFPEQPRVTEGQDIYKGFVFSYYDSAEQRVESVLYTILYDYSEGHFALWRIPRNGSTDVWSDNVVCILAESGDELFDKFINEGVELKITLSSDGVFTVYADGSAVEMAANTNTVTEQGADFASTNVVIGVEVRGIPADVSGTVITELSYTHE